MDEPKRMEHGELAPAARGGEQEQDVLPEAPCPAAGTARGARGESCHPHGEREARGEALGAAPGQSRGQQPRRAGPRAAWRACSSSSTAAAARLRSDSAAAALLCISSPCPAPWRRPERRRTAVCPAGSTGGGTALPLCSQPQQTQPAGESAGLKPGWELYNSDPHSPTGTVAAEGCYPETKRCIVRLRGYYRRSVTELLYPRKTACWKQQYKRKTRADHSYAPLCR